MTTRVTVTNYGPGNIEVETIDWTDDAEKKIRTTRSTVDVLGFGESRDYYIHKNRKILIEEESSEHKRG